MTITRDDVWLAGLGTVFVITAGGAIYVGGFWGGLLIGAWIGAGVGVLIGGLAHAAAHRDDGHHRGES